MLSGDPSVVVERWMRGGKDGWVVRIRRRGFYITLEPQHLVDVARALNGALDFIVAAETRRVA